MEHDDAAAAAEAITALAGRLARDPHVGPEMQRARREFFPAAGAAGPVAPGAAEAADLRFHEWFTLERESEVLGAVPASIATIAGDGADWIDSMAGLWLVQDVTPRTVEARDLQDGQTIDLTAPPGTLRVGDLVVGRLFAEGAGRWTPSTAAAIFRPGSELAQAFLRDLQRLGLDRRLQQIELEHLLLRRPDFTAAMAASSAPVPTEPAAPLEHLEADLDRLLGASGSEHSASSISQQLAMSVRPGQVIGPLLDELAFDTEVDLDAARQLLLSIWNTHHRGAVAAPPLTSSAPGESLGERLVRTLDEGLAQKRDVEELFAQLERMAGIEPEPTDDDDDATIDDERDADDEPAHDADGDRDDYDEDEDDDERDRADAADGAEADEGNLAALVEEYLWESGHAQDPQAELLRLFAALPANAALPHRDLEEITATDVMRLLLHVYLAAPPPERARRVLATFEQLQSFYQWAAEVQEMDVGGVLAGCRGAMLDQVERLQQASIALSVGSKVLGRPGVLAVEQVGRDGFGCRDDDGGDHWIAAAPTALSQLRPGDLVLGALAPVNGHGNEPRRLLGLVVVLPADARALME
jgi:hypothetical protein